MIELSIPTYAAIQLQNLLSLLPSLPNMPEQARLELLQGFARLPEYADILDRVTAELDTLQQAHYAVHGYLPNGETVCTPAQTQQVRWESPLFSADKQVQEAACREAARLEEESGWPGTIP